MAVCVAAPACRFARPRNAAASPLVLIVALLAAVTGCANGTSVPESPTFAADVGPILRARCTGCHHPAGVAPFPLLTYEDARERADLIAAAVQSRRMPPWLPSPSDYAFAGDRHLSDREIAVLARWVEIGAPRGDGDGTEIPLPRDSLPSGGRIGVEAPPPHGWALGEPDLVLELDEPFVPGGGTDVFRNFVLPVPLNETRFVRAVELQPGDARVVHHVTVAVDPTSASRQDDEADPGPGFDGMFSRRAARPPAGFFIGWTPGSVARPSPDGLAWRLDPGSDLVLQMHLRPHGEAVAVRPRIGLFFTDEVPERTPVLIRLGAQTLDIPAGEKAYAVADSFRLPVAVELLGLYPHAHYLARLMNVEAVLLDGEVRRLLRIDEWDFNWQDAYDFAMPVALPAGTLLRMRYVYDNSEANPRNPNHPPRRVVYGPASTDEMAELWIQAVPREQRDHVQLEQELARKSVRDRVEGWRHLVKLDPGDAVAHASLGSYHQAAGQLDQAIEHYRAALRARPAFASVHYNLGIVYEMRGELDSAAAEYVEAVRARPDHAGAHNNLGNVLLALGRRDEAQRALRQAIELDPEQAEPHNNLGRLLWDAGRTDEAIARYREAQRLRPDAAAPYFNLALALATKGRTGDALAEFERGVRLEPRAIEAYLALAWLLATDPGDSVRRPELAIELTDRAAAIIGRPHARVLDILATAHAAAGRFDNAASLEQRALSAAGASDTALINGIRVRLDLFRQRRPYIESRKPGDRR